MKEYLVQIAVIRTIRQYRKGDKTISRNSMRQLELVLKNLKEKEPNRRQAI